MDTHSSGAGGRGQGRPPWRGSLTQNRKDKVLCQHTHHTTTQRSPNTLPSLTLTHLATLSLCTLEASLFTFSRNHQDGVPLVPSCLPTRWPLETPEDAQDKRQSQHPESRGPRDRQATTRGTEPCNDLGLGQIKGRSQRYCSPEA